MSAQPNTGPITGTYRADFGPELQMGDGKVFDRQGVSATFAIRSSCMPTGCIAVADASAGPTLQHKLVFDDLNGEWVAVDIALSSSPAVSKGLRDCGQPLSPEVWETFSLRVEPDGSLAGKYDLTNSNNCNTTRTVRFTRIGDIDMTAVSDPNAEPSRVASPAQGFRGNYNASINVSGTGFRPWQTGQVRTDCLRSGVRCMSYFYSDRAAEPFVFAEGQWSLHYTAPVSCESDDGARVQVERSAQLNLPHPTRDPILELSGQGHQQTKGPGACGSLNQDIALKFERTAE